MKIWTKKKKIIGERQNEKTFNRLRTLWPWIFLVVSVFKEFFMNEKKLVQCLKLKELGDLVILAKKPGLSEEQRKYVLKRISFINSTLDTFLARFARR